MTKEHKELFLKGKFIEILALGNKVEITDKEMEDFLPSFKDFMFCNDLVDPVPPSALLATIIIYHKKEEVYIRYFEAIQHRTYHARLFFQNSTVAYILSYCPGKLRDLLELQKKIGSAEVYIFPFPSYVNMKAFYPKIPKAAKANLVDYFYDYFTFFNPTTFPYRPGFSSTTFERTFLTFVYMFPMGKFNKKWQKLLLNFDEETILTILDFLEKEYRLSIDSSIAFHKSEVLTKSIVGIPEIAALTIRHNFKILQTFFDRRGYVKKYPEIFF